MTVESLAAALKGEGKIAGTPQIDGNIRLGQIVSIDGLRAFPPTVIVGDGEVNRPMRITGNPWEYTPGGTVVWMHQTGSPLIVAVLPIVGSEDDPEEEDYLPFLEVGSTGVAFQNGWGNFGGDYDTAGYWMQTDGWVRLKGLISGGTATAGTAIFDLPPGWAPPFTCYYPVQTNNTTGLLEVDSSGVVRCHTAINNTYVSLNGITFPASWTENTSDFTKMNYGQ